MKLYVKNYLKHFDLGEQDFIFCEYSYIKLGAMIRSADLHHIIYRSHGGCDTINNIIALSRDIHNKAHSEQISKSELEAVHLQFINENPY